MEMMILAIAVIFLALVGLTNLVLGIRRWLARSSGLGDCLLLLQLDSADEAAEAKLVQALETLQLTPGLTEVQLGVVCPPGEAHDICESYSTHKNILLCDSWQQLETALRK